MRKLTKFVLLVAIIKALLAMPVPLPLTVWISTKCEKFFKRWQIPDHLTCLLRNLYACQEATVKNKQEKTE